jgi:1-acyl-sn-glycerol-3-phosphate acyltransferase
MKLWFAKFYLRLFGWKAEGAPPAERKFVLIAAPHTTNWDLPFTLALAVVFGIKVKWLGKHTLFAGPYGWLMRAMGGLAVRRHVRENVVQQSARLFAERDDLILTVPAEGTRSRGEFWKSGFYQIATAANVPIVLGYLDYKRKCGGFGPAIWPSGNLKADMDQIRAFYADKTGKYPEKFTPPRLRDETSQTAVRG